MKSIRILTVLSLVVISHNFLTAQTLYEQMQEKFKDNQKVSLTIHGGLGFGQGFNREQEPSFLFDLPAGVYVQGHKGLFSFGGGGRIQRFYGWESGGSVSHSNVVSHTLLKLFGRGEYIFSEVSKGYLGIGAEAGLIEVIDEPGIINSGNWFVNINGNYFIELNSSMWIFLQYAIEFDKFKSTFNFDPINQHILTNQYMIGMRFSLK